MHSDLCVLCTVYIFVTLCFKNDLQDNINVVENGLNTGKNVGLNVSNLLTCNRNSNIGIHQVTCVFVVM